MPSTLFPDGDWCKRHSLTFYIAQLPSYTTGTSIKSIDSLNYYRGLVIFKTDLSIHINLDLSKGACTIFHPVHIFIDRRTEIACLRDVVDTKKQEPEPRKRSNSMPAPPTPMPFVESPKIEKDFIEVPVLNDVSLRS
ncbi:unnamed protein product, partial [Nesidiocoris tenuis]